jgi:hypothetical protein
MLVSQMIRWLLIAALLAACSVDNDYERSTLKFEPISPPKPGGGEPLLGASGSVIYTQSGQISKDGGVTWAGSNPAILPEFASVGSQDEIAVMTTAFGLGRWNMATDLVMPVNAPMATGLWHLRPNGTLVVTTGKPMARQTSDGAWTQTTLPDPPILTTGPSIWDIQSSANVILVSSSWGVYRSADDGLSWSYVYQPSQLNQNKIVALADGRFLVTLPNGTADQLDAAGMYYGMTTPAFPTPSAPSVGCLGAVVNGDKYSTDLGQTWQPLFGVTPTPLTVASAVCGGDYLLVYVTSPSAWLIRMSTLGAIGELMAYTPKPDTTGSGAVTHVGDTFLSSNLAWKPGDASWSIRLAPANATFFPLDDGTAIAIGNDRYTVYRSTDEGATWAMSMATAQVPMIDRVFVDSAGTLWASVGATGPAALYKSSDNGLTWTSVPSVTTDGIFVLGLTNDVLVGRSGNVGLHVSHDHAETWESLPFPMGYVLNGVTHSGAALTWDDNDEAQQPRAFHLWHDYGIGAAFQQVTPHNMNDEPIDLSAVLGTVTLDASDHMYFYGGVPQQGVWRSTTALP